MSTTLDAIAIGKAVTEIQQPPQRILAAAKELEIEPALILNGVIYFSRPDLDAIAERIYPQQPTS